MITSGKKPCMPPFESPSAAVVDSTADAAAASAARSSACATVIAVVHSASFAAASGASGSNGTSAQLSDTRMPFASASLARWSNRNRAVAIFAKPNVTSARICLIPPAVIFAPLASVSICSLAASWALPLHAPSEGVPDTCELRRLL